MPCSEAFRGNPEGCRTLAGGASHRFRL